MNWYYESGGQQQGPVTEQELDRLLGEGKINQDTLIWREGMASWSPLRQVRSTAAAAAAAPGMAQCSSCGGTFPAGDMMQIQDRLICPNCKPAVVQRLQQGGELPVVGDFNRTGPPWENRAQLGFIKAAWETIKEVLMNPTQTFTTMKRHGGLGNPLLFALLIGTLGGIVAVLFQFLLQGVIGGMMPAMNQRQDPATQIFVVLMGAGVGGIFVIFIVPVMVVIYSFVYAGVFHLSLLICGGAKQPFETTFRVVCYVYGAVSALQVVPVCGGFAFLIWGLVSGIIGLAKTHEIETGRSVLAVLLPLILCCGAISLIVFAGVGAAFAAQGR